VQAIDIRQRREPNLLVPGIALAVFVALVAAGTGAFGALAVLPIFGVVFFALVVLRPAYGIALFLSTFLITYPAALQGTGSLTINNVLGGVFLILLTYKVYREEDWWFLRCRELQLLGFILVMFYLGNRFNGPDPRMVALVGAAAARSETLHTFLTRSIFTLFFVNFIRTRRHVQMIYLLALVFMIVSAISGTWTVMHGGGLHGYRAASSVIGAAANPNRLAMFSIIPIAGVWYLMRASRTRMASLVVLPLISILALAVFMTGSRSGLLGLGVCGLAIMLDEGFKPVQILGLVLAGLVMLALVIQFVPEKTYDRITNLPFTQAGETGQGAGSFQRRWYGWLVALNMFEQHPLVGIGIGNWDLERFISDPAHVTAAPHSSYVLAAVEGGGFVLAAFLLLFLRTWRHFLYVEAAVFASDHPLGGLRWVVKSAKVSLLVLVFFSLFADLWQYVVLFWLIGLAIVMRRMVDGVDVAEAMAA
jgi:O-antigen ligase